MFQLLTAHKTAQFYLLLGVATPALYVGCKKCLLTLLTIMVCPIGHVYEKLPGFCLDATEMLAPEKMHFCVQACIVCLKIFSVVRRPLSTAGSLSIQVGGKSGFLVSGTLRES